MFLVSHKQPNVTCRRVWWLQSALIGHDVSKGVGAEISRVLGIGLHELEDREALCLDLPPHERCVACVRAFAWRGWE